MALSRIFKISRKTFVNPKGWIDYDSLKDQNRTIGTALRSLFSKDAPERQESFAEAKERLNLSDEDVDLAMKNYRLYAMVFMGLGALAFFYGFYLLFRYVSILDWAIGMGVAALFLAQAFRYDFWSLQMRRRTLGLTFDDWKKAILGEKDAS